MLDIIKQCRKKKSLCNEFTRELKFFECQMQYFKSIHISWTFQLFLTELTQIALQPTDVFLTKQSDFLCSRANLHSLPLSERSKIKNFTPQLTVLFTQFMYAMILTVIYKPWNFYNNFQRKHNPLTTLYVIYYQQYTDICRSENLIYYPAAFDTTIFEQQYYAHNSYSLRSFLAIIKIELPVLRRFLNGFLSRHDRSDGLLSTTHYSGRMFTKKLVLIIILNVDSKLL